MTIMRMTSKDFLESTVQDYFDSFDRTGELEDEEGCRRSGRVYDSLMRAADYDAEMLPEFLFDTELPEIEGHLESLR